MLLLVVFAFTSLLITVSALGQNATIAFNTSMGGLMLGSRSASAKIMVDGADWPGVLRVADDLAADFGRVTGVNGSVMVNGTVSGNASAIYNITGRANFNTATSYGLPSGGGGVIIAGTIGKSSLIQTLVNAGKMDPAAIVGQWESFISTVVSSPMPGVASALVIAGSDKRGTIYGLYDVSEQIGVSPWYWFADVVPANHDTIYAINTTKTQGPPSVKYRGFFINDEAPALTGYVNSKFPKSKYGSAFGADFYKSVFELLLRLRANYLWPAQWGSMFNVDDPRNEPLADEYGIVMGSSHTEPMARATNEWSTFGKGAWQWNTNNASIYPFFVEGAQRAKPYEEVITMGMRGSGDTALSSGIETDLLENVVQTQQQILQQVYGNLSSVPQMWCLYKEVQGYYEAGMRVPDDITLLWADDNWGNMRRLPVGNETSRSGGAGIYYHFDYVGDPRNYKWIDTIQLQKTYEQVYAAYARGARNIWIVNVGDIKPEEVPINHFFDLAYDINRFGFEDTLEWLELFAARQFGSQYATEIADVMDTYSFLAARRKYEAVNDTTYSLINYEEADKVFAQWQSAVGRAQAINTQLSAAARPGFFELVLHPVEAGSNFYDVILSAARNRLYANQGRTSANAWAQRTLDRFNYDHQLTVQYNTQLNSKWDHMMDQTHIGYQGYWQQPMRQQTPALAYVQTLERGLAGDMGVSVEQSNATVPGDDIWHTNGGGSLTLPPIDPYLPGGRRWIDIYSIGTNSFNWNLSAASWVHFSQATGTLSPNSNNSDIRVYITVDWSAVPVGAINMTTINITSSRDYGTQYNMPQVMLPYNNTRVASNFSAGHVESDGYIAIEAEHYASITPPSTPVPGSNSSTAPRYQTIPGYGRTLSGVALQPPTAPSLTNATSPTLNYPFYAFTSLTNATKPVNITLYLSPNLNTFGVNNRPLRYSIAIDNLPPKTVQYVFDQPAGNLPLGWFAAVADACWQSTSNATVAAGGHTLKIQGLEPGFILQKIVMDFGGVKKSYLGPPESYRVGVNGTVM